jgi:hypothetical protein
MAKLFLTVEGSQIPPQVLRATRVAEFERAAVRELRRRIAAGAVTPGCSGEAVRFVLTEICWDIARELGPRALVLLALENEELMLMTPTATQALGEDTPCAADVLRWRLYEHLEAVLAECLRSSSSAERLGPPWTSGRNRSFIESTSG